MSEGRAALRKSTQAMAARKARDAAGVVQLATVTKAMTQLEMHEGGHTLEDDEFTLSQTMKAYETNTGFVVGDTVQLTRKRTGGEIHWLVTEVFADGVPSFGGGGAPALHNHDDRYYTETEMNASLGAKQDAATAATDAELTAGLDANALADRNRANHTGTQVSTTISDLVEAVQDIVGGFFGAGTGASVTYNDAANTITVSATGTDDPEVIRDTIGAALIGVGNISVAINDVADTITISTTATVNDTNAALRDRATHTGTQLAATISDFEAASKRAGGLPSGSVEIARINHNGSNDVVISGLNGDADLYYDIYMEGWLSSDGVGRYVTLMPTGAATGRFKSISHRTIRNPDETLSHDVVSHTTFTDKFALTQNHWAQSNHIKGNWRFGSKQVLASPGNRRSLSGDCVNIPETPDWRHLHETWIGEWHGTGPVPGNTTAMTIAFGGMTFTGTIIVTKAGTPGSTTVASTDRTYDLTNQTAEFVIDGLDGNADVEYEMTVVGKMVPGAAVRHPYLRLNGAAPGFARTVAHYAYLANGPTTHVVNRPGDGLGILLGEIPYLNLDNQFQSRAHLLLKPFVASQYTADVSFITRRPAGSDDMIGGQYSSYIEQTITNVTSIGFNPAGASFTGRITLKKIRGSASQSSGKPPLVSVLPNSPVDEEQVYYQTAAMVASGFSPWLLRYRLASTSAHKWEVIGSPILFNEVVTDQPTTLATYAALATAGPSITLPLPGDYLVYHGFEMYPSVAGSSAVMSYDIGATAAVDADLAEARAPVGYITGSSRERVKTGLGAVTLVSKYKVSSGQANFLRRRMRVQPIRVG